MADKEKLLRKLGDIEKSLKEDSLSTHFDAIRAYLVDLPDLPKEVKKNKDLSLPKDWQAKSNTFFLFTDGACRENPGPGATAYLIQDSSEKVLDSGSTYHPLTTNNKMELSSVIEGILKILSWEKKEHFVHLISDSKYVIDGINSWMPGWKARGWKKADNKAPENIELWMELDSLLTKLKKLDTTWVKGHSGHPQNEYCDELANTTLDEALT